MKAGWIFRIDARKRAAWRAGYDARLAGITRCPYRDWPERDAWWAGRAAAGNDPLLLSWQV